ncbi:MAG: hypothetical protein ACE15E_25260 [Acidobacteriota bacterium]
MKPDVFGDLRDWGRILAVLRLLEEKGRLDEVQEGLIRLLRYRQNWQLREKALLSARRVSNPSESLLFAVLEVVSDRGTYSDARTLASQTLALLVPRALARAGSSGGEAIKQAIVCQLSSLLETPEPPVLSDAIEKAMRTIKFVDVEAEASKAAHTSRGEKTC